MKSILYNLRTMIFCVVSIVSLSATAQYCCNANFRSTNTGGSSYLFVPDDSVSSGLLSWNWDFGNGTTSNAQYGYANYLSPGTYHVTLTKQTVFFEDPDSILASCSVTKTIYVDSIIPPCNSEFSYSITNNNSVTFYAEDVVSMPQAWSFGDGNVYYGLNPSHQYSSPGTYTVCHWIYADSTIINPEDSFAYSCQTCKKIIIQDTLPQDSCNAAFGYNVVSGNTVAFYGYDSTGYSTWNFGDGNYSYAHNPIHNYAGPGSYLVGHFVFSYDSLQNVTDSCYTQQYIYIPSVNDSCNAAFGYNVISGNTVAFYGYDSTGYSVWSLGDGNYSYAHNLIHNYPGPGTYIVRHTVFHYDSLQNITDSCSVQDFILIPEINDSCNAAFGYNVISGNTVAFYGYDSTGYSTWNFGDGNYSYAHNPIHNYAGPGSYLVSHYVFSYDSLQNVTDSCYTQQYIYIPAVNDSCNAAFGYNVISGNTVAFYGYDSTGYSVWSLGDGNYSYAHNLIHNYPGPGTYIVRHTVFHYDSLQNITDSCSVLDYILIPEIDTCNAGFTTSMNGNTVSFFGNVTSTNNYWSFGDGNYSYAQFPSHTYAASGNYLVTHMVYSYDTLANTTDSCSTQQYISINVPQDSCNASFTVATYANLAIFQSVDNTAMGYWSFGDGNTSYESNPFHYYTNGGNYLVTKTVVTYDSLQNISDTCQSSQYVYIAPVASDSCNAGFSYETTGNYVAFTAGNTEGYGVWNFGDNTFSVSQNPTHHYASPGSYLVKRTVLTYDSAQHIVDTCYSTQYVYIAPVISDTCFAGFTYYFSSDTITVRANTSGGHHIWTFGDETSSEYSQQDQHHHIYSDNGAYTICHTQYIAGDSCTECQDVILEKPIVTPNPSNDLVTIQSNGGLLDHYYMYDMYGNAVAAQYKIQQSSVNINTSSISAGQYFLQVRYAGGSYSNYKIIIQH